MALKKIKKTKPGIDVEYHRIEQTNINWVERTAEIIVLSYIDKAARMAGLMNFTTQRILLSNATFQFKHDKPVMEQAYRAVKDDEKAGFGDAKDV